MLTLSFIPQVQEESLYYNILDSQFETVNMVIDQSGIASLEYIVTILVHSVC